MRRRTLVRVSLIAALAVTALTAAPRHAWSQG